MRLIPALLLALVLCLVAVGCTDADADETAPPAAGSPEQGVVRVGAGGDAETTLLAAIMAELLRAADLETELVTYSDPRDVRQAIELGDVDVRPAYTGAAWLESLGRADPPGDPRESFTAVRSHGQEQGLVWIAPRFGEGPDEPPANATFAFVVAGPPSVDADLRTISQLATRLAERPEALLCVDEEFGTRSDGLRAVLSAYSIPSEQPVLAADPEEAVRGVLAGDCIAGLTTSTDGAAWAAGVTPLIDDLEIFPAFVPLPQLRHDVVEEQPKVRTALEPLARELTTTMLGGFNARVVSGEAVEVVAVDAARELLQRAGRPVPAQG